MLHLNARIIFICFAALLFVVACADTQKKQAETTEAPSQTAETPSQTAEANVEEVTLTVTGMT